jgi:hypothetical protein
MTLLKAALRKAATLIDHRIGWHRLPPWMGLLVLVGLRSRLRDENLIHTSLGLPETGDERVPPACRRAVAGTFNDLAYPSMGAAGTPFGRSVPLAAVHLPGHGGVGLPSPRRISNELLARKDFVPAGKLNVLAAAWVQFMIHDWFSHDSEHTEDRPNAVEIPVEAHDEWRKTHGAMRIHPTPPDPSRPPCSASMPPTFLNTVTHWWDASQIYGSDHKTLGRIRDGAVRGHIRMDDASPDRLPLDPLRGRGYRRADLTGFNTNWWIGLSLLHSLFALEHNAICDRLHDVHPRWSDEDLFAHARLINAAVIAKIHTLEWTPAILDHPTVPIGLRTEWSGLAQERGIGFKLLALLSSPEIRNGIRQSRTEHHRVPYSLTEEFVAVYRMHTLLPDSMSFRSSADGGVEELTLRQLIFGNARDVVGVDRFSMEDVAYSFGTQRAGAITLHNYPNALRELELPDGRFIDLAAVDIFRDRERGVPRYNEFRRLVGRRPAVSFADLVGREGRAEGWDRELQRVYGDLESVDLMVGLFAEPKPRGFGFSDTAFRIFLLMNSRRLQSDRFFTTDFTEDVYSKEGLKWLEERTMTRIMADHWPEVKRRMGFVKNPFHLWNDENRM